MTLRLLDPGEPVGDLLEPREPLDVGLERLAPGTRPGAADRVGGLDQHRLGALVRHVVVVGLDAVDHRRALAVLARHLHAQLDVGALVLVGEHLADVVQQPAPLGQRHVEVQLGRHHPGEPRHFLRVIVDVLPVGGAVAHPADQLDHLGVEPVNPGVVGRLLAELDQLALELASGP